MTPVEQQGTAPEATKEPTVTAAGREALDILRECRAILEQDHFVYDSGQHGSGWIDKDVINERMPRVRRLCELLAEEVRDLGAEVLCGPATGGLIVAQWTALCLDAIAVFTEHDPAAHPDASSGRPVRGRFVLRRGYDQVVRGRRVLVVDDVINTGLSIRQTVEAVRDCGGIVIGAGAHITRGNASLQALGVETLRVLAEYDIPSWPAQACALCASKVPVNTRYAHGADFLAALEEHSR
jgi:orotate phosphoribosyltransferase